MTPPPCSRLSPQSDPRKYRLCSGKKDPGSVPPPFLKASGSNSPGDEQKIRLFPNGNNRCTRDGHCAGGTNIHLLPRARLQIPSPRGKRRYSPPIRFFNWTVPWASPPGNPYSNSPVRYSCHSIYQRVSSWAGSGGKQKNTCSGANCGADVPGLDNQKCARRTLVFPWVSISSFSLP